MFTKLTATLTVLGCLSVASPALALNASSSGSGSNTYLFIDNDVDNEYFITQARWIRALPGPMSGRVTPPISAASVISAFPGGAMPTAITICGLKIPPSPSHSLAFAV